ncbi:MAG TPA: hypothetical protein PK916_04190 [Bacteroidota bacterium]|nr:hypothetical protein [Bacteroidota bacterium]
MKRTLPFATVIVLLLLAACGKRESAERPAADSTAVVEAAPTLPDSVLSRRFTPEFTTPEALAQAFLQAVEKKDRKGLHALLVSEREFNDWLWPEFPASDPAMNVPQDFAWSNLAVKSDKGLRRILRDIGGQKLTLASVYCNEPEELYRSFVVQGGTAMDVVDAQGLTATLDILGSMVRLNGTYKFMSYRE